MLPKRIGGVARTKRFSLLPALIGTSLAILPSCEGLLTTINPCGTILNFCTQEDIDLLFADVPDYDLDPTCTIPFATGPDCAGGPIFPTPGSRP